MDTDALVCDHCSAATYVLIDANTGDLRCHRCANDHTRTALIVHVDDLAWPTSG